MSHSFSRVRRALLAVGLASLGLMAGAQNTTANPMPGKGVKVFPLKRCKIGCTLCCPNAIRLNGKIMY